MITKTSDRIDFINNTKRLEMSQELEGFRKFCHSNLKLKKERIARFSQIFKIHHHFTVEELHSELEKNKIHIIPPQSTAFCPIS